MNFTKRKLKQMVNEEYQKLIKEGLIPEAFDNKSDFGGRSPGYSMPLPKLYSNRVQAARKGNQLPPEDSNWYRFAKHLDIGVLDLDELAQELGYRNFDDLDISISPRGMNGQQAEEVADVLFGMIGADDIDVYDALEA